MIIVVCASPRRSRQYHHLPLANAKPPMLPRLSTVYPPRDNYTFLRSRLLYTHISAVFVYSFPLEKVQVCMPTGL